MSAPKSAPSLLKQWLAQQGWFNANKQEQRIPRPATHIFMDGGLTTLTESSHYDDFYQYLIQDVLKNQGRVVACEAFPPIFGHWPTSIADHQLKILPPPYLLQRVATALNVSMAALNLPDAYWKLPSVPPLSASVVEQENASLIQPNKASPTEEDKQRWDAQLRLQYMGRCWEEMPLVIDLDYGSLVGDGENKSDKLNRMRGRSAPTSEEVEKTVVRHIILIQAVLRNYSIPIEHTTCIVSVADQNQVLGVHLYFPYTRLYPEEAQEITEECLSRLQDAIPQPELGYRSVEVHMPTLEKALQKSASVSLPSPSVPNTKTCIWQRNEWINIVDTGIVMKTLRLPFVQKMDKEAKPKVVKRGMGKMKSKSKSKGGDFRSYKDRRYFPRWFVLPNGEFDRNEMKWFEAMKRFVLNLETPESKLSTNASAVGSNVSLSAHDRITALLRMADTPNVILPDISMTESKCKLFLMAAYLMMSHRHRLCDRPHTRFVRPAGKSQPSYPNSWMDFFASIWQGANAAQQRINQKNGWVFKPILWEADQPLPVVTSLAANEWFVVYPRLTCYTSPLGRSTQHLVPPSSPSLKPLGWKPSSDAKERKFLQTYGHLRISEHEDYEQLSARIHGADQKAFAKPGQLIWTPGHDPFGVIAHFQKYLRSAWMREAAKHYADVQIARIVLSPCGGFYKIMLMKSRHYCHLKAAMLQRSSVANPDSNPLEAKNVFSSTVPIHGKSGIEFTIVRTSGQIFQRCWSRKCAPMMTKQPQQGQQQRKSMTSLGYNLGTIQDPTVAILFRPKEMLTLNETKSIALKPEQVKIANLLLEQCPFLAEAPSKARKRSTLPLNTLNSLPTPRSSLSSKSTTTTPFLNPSEKENSEQKNDTMSPPTTIRASFTDGETDVDIDPVTGGLRKRNKRKRDDDKPPSTSASAGTLDQSKKRSKNKRSKFSSSPSNPPALQVATLAYLNIFHPLHDK